MNRLELLLTLWYNADALLDAAEAADRVTALADEWERTGWMQDSRRAVAADLRAALAAPDNHKDTPGHPPTGMSKRGGGGW